MWKGEETADKSRRGPGNSGKENYQEFYFEGVQNSSSGCWGEQKTLRSISVSPTLTLEKVPITEKGLPFSGRCIGRFLRQKRNGQRMELFCISVGFPFELLLSEATLHNATMMDTCQLTFVKTHRPRYNTKSEP